jgi:hypothetical protein
MENTVLYDNAVVHYYPLSPWIAKAEVNVRCGSKIVFRAVLRDLEAAGVFLRRFPEIPVKTITHC